MTHHHSILCHPTPFLWRSQSRHDETILNIPRFRSLLLVSCCRHRMQRVADDPAKDDDFPLSDNLKNVFKVDWKEHPFSSSISYAEETTIINSSKIG